MNWIKPSERLPNHDQWVLFMDSSKEVYYGIFIKYEDMWRGRFQEKHCGGHECLGFDLKEDEAIYWAPIELPEDIK